MDQQWFEMEKIRHRKLDNAVWIPLRAYQEEEVGEYGYPGYKSDMFAVGSVAVPLDKRAEAEKLGWTDVGLIRSHRGSIEGGQYVTAEIFDRARLGEACALVLDQSGNGEGRVWHLHQDLVLALHLTRENDVWLAMDEGYIEVARLRMKHGRPTLLEIRAGHLKAYLCARGMALYVSSYRKREEVVADRGHITWPANPYRPSGIDRWEGRVIEIHEGGEPFGSSAYIMHVGRKDIDFETDVPQIGIQDEFESKSWTRTYEGQKIYRVMGELWRNEWIEPGKNSPRLREDNLPSSVSFAVDASGTQETAASLTESGRWLWFRPDVISRLIQYRGARLEWYTRDTGGITCSPSYSTVAFGVNKLGLVNVYAKDIALLPEWQQQLWAGSNVSPDGGVSDELLSAQAAGVPADTQAPETFLPKGLDLLNKVCLQRFGFAMFREHRELQPIVTGIHRIRSTDSTGFFSLAKDLARVVVDSIDSSALQKIMPPPSGEKWGSLKSMENVTTSLLVRSIRRRHERLWGRFMAFTVCAMQTLTFRGQIYRLPLASLMSIRGHLLYCKGTSCSAPACRPFMRLPVSSRSRKVNTERRANWGRAPETYGAGIPSPPASRPAFGRPPRNLADACHHRKSFRQAHPMLV